MSVYETRLRLRSCDVDAYRRLRLSTLFTLLQEAAIAHTIQLGVDRDKTLDRGLLWIITQQRAVISRLPEYGEEIVLRSWPGKTLHLFFPRYASITGAGGEVLLRAGAYWALMDRDTRKMVFPEEHGVALPGVSIGEEIAMSRVPRGMPEGETGRFTVPFSYVDLNGHMNNTRYFDLAADRMPAALRDSPVREIDAEYNGEARLGEEIALHASAERDLFVLAGENGRRLFRLQLRYGKDV